MHHPSITRKMRTLARLFLLSMALLGLGLPATAQTKLLRFPDIHDNRIVFSYGGDLWLVAANGGLATRLTAHPGVEFFAKFSPDGKQIAFTGQYDGDEQVYVIPSSGGEPKQLTYYPARGPLPDRGRAAALRPPLRGRRAEAVDLLPGARPPARPLGLRRPGLRLDPRRQVGR